jgi:hypothetical protein
MGIVMDHTLKIKLMSSFIEGINITGISSSVSSGISSPLQ